MIATIIGSVTALIVAITGLVRAIKTENKLQAHLNNESNHPSS